MERVRVPGPGSVGIVGAAATVSYGPERHVTRMVGGTEHPVWAQAIPANHPLGAEQVKSGSFSTMKMECMAFSPFCFNPHVVDLM